MERVKEVVIIADLDIEQVNKVMREFAEAISCALQEFVEMANQWLPILREAIRKVTPRRDFSRPQNQRIRPLLIDRHRKVYHCRNAI